METTIPKPTGCLAALTPEDMRAFLNCADRMVFRTDQEIVRQGQHNASLYIVQSGILHVRRHAKGHDVLLGRLEPGSFFGEISLFDPGPTTASVRAVADGVAMQIRREHFDHFMAELPEAGAKVLTGIVAEMARRLRRADEQLMDSIMWGGLLK